MAGHYEHAKQWGYQRHGNFFHVSRLTAQCLTWCFVFRPVGVSLVLIPVDNVVDIFLQGTTKCWPETWRLLG